MQIPATPQARSHIVLREEFEGRYLLFDLETGRLTGINPTGAFIWRQLDGRNTLAAVIAKTAAAYRVSTKTARTDAIAFIESLAANNLLANSGPGCS